MELWIRTQDKEKLVAVYELELDSYSANKKDYWTINNYGSTLGTYETKGRALEVLDEIQKFITINENINGSYEDVDMKLKALILKYSIRIYNMPQE